MIPKILSQTRALEAYSLSIKICEQLSDYDINDSYLNQLSSSILETSNQLLQASNKTKYKSELTNKDQERDYRFRAIYYLVQGYTYHPDQSIKTHAETLMQLFIHFGLETLNKNFSAESTYIQAILLRLKQAPYLKASEELSGVSENVERLKIAQDEFKQTEQVLMKQRVKEEKEPKTTQLKLKLLKQVNSKLIVYIEAMILANKETYGSYADFIKVVISKNNTTVKKRLKKYQSQNID